MSFKDDPDLGPDLGPRHGLHQRWFGAALVFAAGLAAALLLVGSNRSADDGSMLRTANTRPLIMLPFHLPPQ